MKTILILSSLLLVLNAHGAHPRYSDSCTDVSKAEQDIELFELRLEAAQKYIQDCTGTGGSNRCIQFMLDKSYSPGTAKSTCDGIDSNEFACLSYLMNKSYSPSTARNSCESMTAHGVECVRFMIEKSYSPGTARTTCLDITKSQLDCIKDMMDRGYSPGSATSTCK